MAGRASFMDPAALGAVAAGSANESTPLFQEEPEVFIDHKDSVYSFMFFQPPLSRRRTGHYWTVEVMLAFALLVLNVTLQVGLTLIAGHHIVARSVQFQTSLVSTGEDHGLMPWDEVIHDMKTEGNKLHQNVQSTLGNISGAAAGAGAPACCNGADCSELKLPCCDRTGAKPYTTINRQEQNLTDAVARTAAGIEDMPGDSVATFLSFGKPGGGGGKGKGKSKKQESEKGDMRPNPVCLKNNKTGTLDCTPRNYKFTDAWKELDRNGDGEWTLEEARADEANLGCRLGLPVEEVFRATCRGVVRDNEDTSQIPPYSSHVVPVSLSDRRAVTKDYFDWWSGLAVICVAHDVSRCGELVSKGMFDGAIGAGQRSTRGGVRDLDSALDYCQRMLRPGGMCEKTLPGSYMMYRSRVAEKCGASTYATGHSYNNPFDASDVMSTIAVKYSTVDQYSTASSFEFCFFQGLILFLWFVNLVGELKAIIELWDFVLSFEIDDSVPLFGRGTKKWVKPLVTSARKHHSTLVRTVSGISSRLSTPREEEDKSKSSAPEDEDLEGEIDDGRSSDDEHEDEDDHHGNHVVTKISRDHKVMVSLMLFIRFFLLIYMFHVGSMFLLTNHSYDDLLLNAVALAFIFELPEFLYTFLVSDEMKSDLDGTHTKEYTSALPTKGFGTLLLSKSLWGIVIIPAMVIIVVIFNYEVITMPALRALQCTCFQEGAHCDVSSRFGKQWWDSYWKDMAKIFQHQAGFR